MSKIEEQVAEVSLLMNQTRLTIFKHLLENPCDHPRGIARTIDKSLNSVMWNLEKMLEGGLVESRHISGRRVFWPVGMILEQDLAIVSMTRNEWFEPVLKALGKSGGKAREKDLVERLGGKQQKVHGWLRKMAEVGILEAVPDGSWLIYSVSARFIESTEHYDAQARIFMKSLIEIVRSEGLMPKKIRPSGTRISMNVKLPMGYRRIHLECTPLAIARKYARTSEKTF